MPDFFAPRGQLFDLNKDIPDLAGQVYIVTGASTGIGFAIVAQLLAHNAAKIITLSSRRAEALASIEKLRSWGDVSRVQWRECNLSSLKQVDEVARRLLEEEAQIDAVVLNAAIGITKSRLSQDSIDDHFQINMLSQLHLAMTLLPTMSATAALQGAPSRLVFMTSATHHHAPSATRFEHLAELNQDLGTQAHYYRSKLAQILIVRQLAARLSRGEFNLHVPGVGEKDCGILINATHPGDYNRTPLTDNLRNTFGFLGWILLFFLSPFMPDPMTQGCQSALFACTPNVELLHDRPTGQYIVPSKRIVVPSRHGRDDTGLGLNVWRLSQSLLSEKLQK